MSRAVADDRGSDPDRAQQHPQHPNHEVLEVEPAAASGPLAGDPSLLGLPTFVVGSIFLGLTLIGYTPAASVGSALPVIIFATGIGLVIATIWAAAVGQSMVASVFGIFAGFWLSYAALLLGALHGWFGVDFTVDSATTPGFLISWLVVIGVLTLVTLRLPSSFTALFALVEVALALDLVSILTGTTVFARLAGVAVFLFAAIGAYLFANSAVLATGGRAMNLGTPLQR